MISRVCISSFVGFSREVGGALILADEATSSRRFESRYGYCLGDNIKVRRVG